MSQKGRTHKPCPACGKPCDGNDGRPYDRPNNGICEPCSKLIQYGKDYLSEKEGMKNDENIAIVGMPSSPSGIYFSGLYLKDVNIDETIEVQTKNTLYTIKKTGEEEYLISGNQKYCPEPTAAIIAGSTWGGSMIKSGFIGLGMYMEMYFANKAVKTSMVYSINKI